MTKFDEFCSSLIEEAKRFFEKAIESSDVEAKAAYYHSAILLGISSLEAYVNGISDEICIRDDIPILEKSLLLEKEIKLENGVFSLTNKLKIYRLTERIEYLFKKFSSKELKDTSAEWRGDLNASIRLRNLLVHPKSEVEISEKQVKILLECVIDCLSSLSKSVYGSEFPFYKIGLQSKKIF